MIVYFVVYPLLAVVLFTVLDSWLWRGIVAAAAVGSFFAPPPWNIVVPAGLLIVILVGKPFVDMNKRLKY